MDFLIREQWLSSRETYGLKIKNNLEIVKKSRKKKTEIKTNN